MAYAKIGGLVGCPVTPFDEKGNVDEETFAKLLEFLIKHGSDAMVVLMHSGENLKLSTEERMRVAEIAVQVVNKRIPVVIHTSAPGTDEVVKLSRHAEAIGADGVNVVAPYHWRPSAEGLIDHFVTVAKSVDIAFIAYNFPERLGVTVTPYVIRRVMEQCPNFVGLKDASLVMEYLAEVCRTAYEINPDFAVLTGTEFTLPLAALGGKGNYSPCGAVAPRLVKELSVACLVEKDYEKARPLQYKASALWALLKENYPQRIKAAMKIMGRPCGDARKPYDPIDAEGMKQLEKELEALGILESEPHGW